MTRSQIRHNLLRLSFAICGFWLVAACSGERDVSPTFHADENPQNLGDWGMVAADGKDLVVSDAVTPYDLATPLFSDYALKLRTVWTPDGETARYHATDAFDFPVGTVVTKTFYYPKEGSAVSIGAPAPLSAKEIPLTDYRLIETRLLVRRAHGWDALPYVWNEAQTEAVLKRTGDVKAMTLALNDGAREEFAYLVPNANQCAACHVTNAATKALQPIGLKARHLNKQSAYSPAFNQLDHWTASGLLSAEEVDAPPANADWTDETASVKARARAYLDINCSHCHNPNGAADTSGLNLEPDAAGPALGVCKSPIAAGQGTGGRQFGIAPGAPEASILAFRMETTEPAAMMPELGRALAHDEGVALINEWITAMEGTCG
ncbi:MAG: SO2930 family diheme c-type cytochrome [Pseudomonadota bacterium]